MTTLKPGDKAPAFSGTDQNGIDLSLEQLKGNKVVLYFYPKDNTPGCTAQACNLRDNYNILLSKGYKVVGISPDSIQSHKKFADKFLLPFPLLPDTDHSIANAFQVWGPKKFMGRVYDGIHRTTFIIDENGTIEKVIAEVDTKEHTKQIV